MRLQFLIFLALFQAEISAQKPFNKIYDVGFKQQNPYALTEHNNHYYIAGQLVTEDSIAQSGIFYSKFDLKGNQITTNKFIIYSSPHVFF